MAETKAEEEHQTLDSHPQKRKPELDCSEQGEIDDREAKKPKNLEADCNDDADEKQKAKALDKGKGKMVVEEEEEGNDDSDSDLDSDDDDDIVGAENDGDDSDFCDDPLAEVDLENILPTSARRRAPPHPGAYTVNDPGDDDDDDDDEDVAALEDDEDSD